MQMNYVEYMGSQLRKHLTTNFDSIQFETLPTGLELHFNPYAVSNYENLFIEWKKSNYNI